jgi:type IV pilus assembly protein PilV
MKVASMYPRQSGFTLLEVLIAIVVLSIGLLGLAGIMASSMRNNQSATHRTQASVLAYDIIDRMRANRAAARAGGYNSAMSAGVCAAGAPAGTVQAQDVAGWRRQLACALPEGKGSIAVAGGKAAVVIQWNDSRGTQGLANQSFTVESQL